MKNAYPNFAVIITCSFAMLFCMCIASPDAIPGAASSEFKPGTTLKKEIVVTDTSVPLTDADRAALLKVAAAEEDTHVVPQGGGLDVFLKGDRNKSYSYHAGKWSFWEVVTDPITRIKITVIFGEKTNPFENKLSLPNAITRESSTGRLSITSMQGILSWAKANQVTIYTIEDSEHDIIYVYVPRRAVFVMINERSQILGEYEIDKNAYVEITQSTAALNAFVPSLASSAPLASSPGISSPPLKSELSASPDSGVTGTAAITAANMTASLAEAGKKTEKSTPESPEAKMLEVLHGYKIGVTTHQQCMDDITAGSWDMNFGGMGMEVLLGKVTLGMSVGIGGRDICDLVFEGDNPQPTGTGKAPDFGKFLLKEITFKS